MVREVNDLCVAGKYIECCERSGSPIVIKVHKDIVENNWKRHWRTLEVLPEGRKPQREI